MNRIIGIIILGAALTFGSCVKEITLYPYELPDMVESSIRKVECFDEHNAAFIATDEGVLLLYGEDQVLFPARRYDEMESVNWTSAQVLYSAATEMFWVIDDTMYVNLGRNSYDVHYDNTPFYAPTKAYSHFALSPKGDLYRLGYYKEFWDPNSGFFSDYYIGIYKFNGQLNNTWVEYQTEMTVNSEFLGKPVFMFENDGTMIINSNPTYRVTEYSESGAVFSAFPKSGQGFVYKTSYQPHLGSDGKLYGLRTVPGIQTPVASVIETTVEGTEVSLHLIEELCTRPEEDQGAVKLIDWKGDVVRFYIRYFTNNLSTKKDVLGFILTYDMGSGSCDLKSLKSDEDLKFSESIQDLDVYNGTVFIGTREGLIVYDLSTDLMDSYLQLLIAKQNGDDQ